MKQILCFGDSNTWGYDGESGERLPFKVRWTGRLQKAYEGKDVRIIEEGLCGRTTVFEDPFRQGRRGTALLPTLLETHHPVDLVVLMLGTNDCKTIFGASAEVIRCPSAAWCRRAGPERSCARPRTRARASCPRARFPPLRG